MKALLVIACGLAVATAQAPDWNGAQRVDIVMRNFKFEPGTITLEHGGRYLLHFSNQASGGHDFAAKRFFAASTIAPSDQAAVKDGVVELEGGDAADVRLVAPPPGRYAVHCSHFMHSTFGMKGEIVVR